MAEQMMTLKKETAVIQAPNEGAVILSIIDRMSTNPDMPVEKIERMLDMHERMQKEASRRMFLSALSAMQAELPAATRKGTGHNNKKYARFEDVTEALRPHLKENGFSLTYRIKQSEKAITIVGVLGHASGHAEETEITLPADASGSKNNVQAWASSVSYGKRYVALTLTGIATDDDDDGKAAGGAATISEDETIALREHAESVNADLKAFCTYFKIEKLSDLKTTDLKRAHEALKKKAGK